MPRWQRAADAADAWGWAMMRSTGEAMLIAAVGCITTMKLVSLVVRPRAAPRTWFLVSPLLATDSWAGSRRPTRAALGALLIHLGTSATLLVLAVVVALWGVSMSAPSLWLAGYSTMPVAWLIGEVLGTSLQILYAAGGWLVPPHHRSPWRARSLSEFWSGHWNRWVADWLAQIVYRPLRRWRMVALPMTFLASGLLHEIFMSVPLMITTGHNIFGLPTLYFIIQAAAVVIDRTLVGGHAVLRRLLLWAAVAAPAPMILNECFLRAFAFVG
jgi:hypothetical protein